MDKKQFYCPELDSLVQQEVINAVNQIMGKYKKYPLGLTYAKRTGRFTTPYQKHLELNYGIGLNTIADLKEATKIKIKVVVE